MANGWKITAIIFICLFVAETALMVWAVNLALDEEEAINDCYYNTCAGYPDAWYEAGVCSCYDINEYGEYEEVMTSYKS